MPERSKGVVLSTTVFALVGSNPTARILIFHTAMIIHPDFYLDNLEEDENQVL